MNKFITFDDLNDHMYLFNTKCQRKHDHIWAVEYVDKYSCLIRQLTTGYRKEYYIGDFPDNEFICISNDNKGYI